MDPVYEVKEETTHAMYDMPIYSPRFKLMSDYREDNIQPKRFYTTSFHNLYDVEIDEVIAEDNNEENIGETEKKKKLLIKLENFIDKSEIVNDGNHIDNNLIIDPIKEENIEDEEVIHIKNKSNDCL
jgi:hypothetical protein